MKKDLLNTVLTAFALVFSLPVVGQMGGDGYLLANREYGEYGAPVDFDPFYGMNYRYYGDNYGYYDPMSGYSISTYTNHDYNYYYNYAYTLHARCKKGYQGFSSDAYLHRRYDNSTNFSSGISSYQGTSTGPGPNGGYPGSPRGVYKTNYIPRE